MKTQLKQYTPGSDKPFRASHFERWLASLSADEMGSIDLNAAERDHLVKLGRQNMLSTWSTELKNIFPGLK